MNIKSVKKMIMPEDGTTEFNTLKFTDTDGVLVNSVGSKTPAQQGGIKRGDIIFQFNYKWIAGRNFKFRNFIII